MSSRRFHCRDVDRLLDLEDLALRPDRKALAHHLATCSRCRDLAPELEWLYGKFEARDECSESSWVLRAGAVAAAALVIAITLISFRAGGGEVDRSVTMPAASVVPTTPRLLPAHHSHFEAEVIRLLPGQENRSSSSSTTLSPAPDVDQAAAPMEWTR